jgi:hypothetical protein
MSSHPNPIGLHARRTWWPSAATCAFLASGVEIFSNVATASRLLLAQRCDRLVPPWVAQPKHPKASVKGIRATW